MGYYAPSAEEVYRYALRLDRSHRSLTDRFGLSIVFVNDTSPVCREFLQTYCVDLCFRTADRIRFIFFSELPEQEIQRIVDGMNRGVVDPSKGILKSILSLIDWSRYHFVRHFDYEYEPWRSLRPESLRSLRSLEDIEKRLNLECDMKTAMPGAGMAMQFAQRLGIGQYVPCILVFTDIGELHVDLMPIRNMSPGEIYSHVRDWIDRFYEVNQDKIERWRRVEDEIEKLCSQANSSLWQVREWREKTLKMWRNLQSISDSIRTIDVGGRNEWKTISTANSERDSYPIEVRNVFRDFLTTLPQLEQRNSVAHQLGQAEEILGQAEGIESIFATLRQLDREGFKELRVNRPASLRSALDHLWERCQLARDPRTELKAWLNRSSNAHLSLKRFEKFRRNWIHRVTGSGHSSLEDEYERVLATVRQLPLSIEPMHGATIVLDALAVFYSVDAEEEWQNATAAYRDYIRRYLEQVCKTSPQWLRSELPELTIEDALLSLRDLYPFDLDTYLSSKPDIQHAVERTESLQSQILTENRKENDEVARKWKAAVIADLRGLIEKFVVGDDEWTSAKEDTLVQLRQWRRIFEVQVYDANKKIRRGHDPWKAIDYVLLNQLMSALDEYERVVETIQYPHLKDPLVQKVHLRIPVTDAVGAERHAETSATQSLRDKIVKATKSEEESAALWSKVRTEALDWTPASKLSKALLAAMSRERLAKILGQYPGPNIEQRVEQVLANHQTTALLESLNETELSKVADIVAEDDRRLLEYHSQMKAGKVDLILSQIGVYNVGSVGGLNEDQASSIVQQDKIARDDFDVFLAYNAKDKPTVLKISKSLVQRGIYPWIDVEQVPPGRWFQDVIQAVIPKVKSAAIFLGRYGIGRWQALEIRSFVSQCVERNIPVIPVLLPGVEEIPQELAFLRELNWVRFHNRIDEEEPLNQLIWGITGKKRLPRGKDSPIVLV